MKIRTLILAVLIVSLAATTGVVVSFSSSAVSGIGDTTEEALSTTLEGEEIQSLVGLSQVLRDYIDGATMQQFALVSDWAQAPILVETAKMAQGYSLEELYEMWSAEATREYDEGEAVGDGDPYNDVNPAASEYLINLSKSTGVHPEVFITDSRGYAIAANGATGDFDQGPDDWRVFLDDSGQPYYTQHGPAEGGEGWYRNCNESPTGMWAGEVEFDDSASIWGMDIIAQIRDPQTGDYLGQLKAVYNYGAYLAQMCAVQSVMGVHEVKIVDAAGIVLATSDADQSVVNNPDATVADSPFFVAAQAGNNAGSVLDTDEHGDAVYAAYAVSNDNGRFIVTTTQESEDLWAPIDETVSGVRGEVDAAGSDLRSNLLIIGVVVGMAVLAIAFAVIYFRLSSPIRKLSAAADSLSRGDIDGLQVDVSGKDEIGQLGEGFKGVLAAFNEMNDELQRNGNG
jgi:HAMP domain-containing protein